jgi:hypothetical protein
MPGATLGAAPGKSFGAASELARYMHLRKVLAYFGLSISTVSTEGTNGRQLACLRPSRHGLRIDTKHRSYFARGKKSVISLYARHVPFLPYAGIVLSHDRSAAKSSP